MKPLTKKQHEILQYIKSYLQTYQYAPSYREIMQKFSFTSLGTVYRYIHLLKEKGFLEAEKQSSRSLHLLGEGNNGNQLSELLLPFIGHISAGEPITLFSKSLSFQVPRSLVQAEKATYVLQVRGNSLMEELIADGDYLLVEARQQAYSGETIIALLNQNDILIKKYFREKDFARLTSLASQNHSIMIPEEEMVIQGVITAIIRQNYTSSSSSSGAGS